MTTNPVNAGKPIEPEPVQAEDASAGAVPSTSVSGIGMDAPQVATKSAGGAARALASDKLSGASPPTEVRRRPIAGPRVRLSETTKALAGDLD